MDKMMTVRGMHFGVEVLGTVVRLHSFDTEEIVETSFPSLYYKDMNKFVGHWVGTIVGYGTYNPF